MLFCFKLWSFKLHFIFCDAVMWYEERVDVSKGALNPTFSLCCQHGIVRKPSFRKTPDFFDALLDYKGGSRASRFRHNIRIYNSMFQFSPVGGKMDNTVNDRGGPYIFNINGQNHHRIGSLLSTTGQNPKFAQLYIYDMENECSNRMAIISGNSENCRIDRSIVG
ncbi:hypothetical protein PTKIN_Ptkin08bG0083200 [Pterospermum kingtungense]